MSDPIRVLHVEDDSEFAAMTAELLERQDDSITIESVRGASDALEELESREVDCIVSDYQMPGMDGIGLLETVRESHPDLPFILFTGEGSETVASSAIAAGVTDYLQKQVDGKQYELLAHRILNAVKQYRSKRRATDLDRIRTLTREVNRALVRASSRDSLEADVCSIISNAEPYQFAWIGEHDPENNTVEARAGAGVEQGYLDAIRITTDERATGQGPTGRAIRTGKPAFTQDIEDAESYEPWREEALGRGYRSSGAIPLTYQGQPYGVLNVYADRPDAFDEREQGLLVELGEDIAHALHALDVLESRQAKIARLETLFEESPDMIDVHDETGTIIDANPVLAEKLGYSKRELIGKRIWDIDVTIDEEETREILDETVIGDRIQVEARYRRKDGSTFPVEVHIRRLDVEGGRRFLVISRDITEQKERERTLREQNDRLEEFAGIVSHDLRNPLGAAMGYLELAQTDSESPHLDKVASNLDRMERIIDDVLWLAREGQGIGSTETIDLQEAVESSWAVVAGPESSATIDVAEGIGPIHADYDRLRQLLENLIGNALEHAGPDVSVRLEPLDDGFAIADDGPGIPPDQREAVFDIGHSTTESGTGFGLYIVREIANAHEWDIDLLESAQGGTRVEFTGVSLA